MVLILVGYQAHFNAVTSGFSCKMPLFSLVCAGQAGPTAVHRDHSVSSVLDNSYLSALSHYDITPWIAPLLNLTPTSWPGFCLLALTTACVFNSVFLKDRGCRWQRMSAWSPSGTTTTAWAYAGNAFAYGNGEGQNMRDTLATSANSLTDTCSKTKLSTYWRGPTNHYFLHLWLSSCACPTGKGKKILPSCCSKSSWAPYWWRRDQSTQSWDILRQNITGKNHSLVGS